MASLSTSSHVDKQVLFKFKNRRCLQMLKNMCVIMKRHYHYLIMQVKYVNDNYEIDLSRADEFNIEI